MKKLILTVSVLAALGFAYANVDGNGKGKKKACCSKTKSCCNAKSDSTKSAEQQ